MEALDMPLFDISPLFINRSTLIDFFLVVIACKTKLHYKDQLTLFHYRSFVSQGKQINLYLPQTQDAEHAVNRAVPRYRLFELDKRLARCSELTIINNNPFNSKLHPSQSANNTLNCCISLQMVSN